MSEQVELILDGTLCQECQCIMPDLKQDDSMELLESPGHPRTCDECAEEAG